MLRLGGFIRNICQVYTLRLSAPPDLLTSQASEASFFFRLLLRFPGSCSATPEWAITPRGDGNHLGFFLATFDVAINVVRVSPLLLKGACSLPEPALVGAPLARSLGEIAMMPARTLRFRLGGKAMTPYRQIRNFSGPCQMSVLFPRRGSVLRRIQDG